VVARANRAVVDRSGASAQLSAVDRAPAAPFRLLSRTHSPRAATQWRMGRDRLRIQHSWPTKGRIPEHHRAFHAYKRDRASIGITGHRSIRLKNARICSPSDSRGACVLIFCSCVFGSTRAWIVDTSDIRLRRPTDGRSQRACKCVAILPPTTASLRS